jgi:hypothetical protein
MTDRGPDLDETRISDELATWFAGEVRQAELDLRRAPLRPARARRGPARGIAAPAAGAILVVVLVIAGITRLPSLAGPATEPTGSAIPSSSVAASEPAATATPAPTGVIEDRYGDGIPMTIDGERVLRIPTLDDVAPADDSPFLLGAWTIDWNGVTMSCLPVPGTPPPFGPTRCNSRWLTEGPANHGDSIGLESWPTIPAGPVVVRIHRHDERAELCEGTYREGCETLAVIEAVVWTGDEATAAAPIGPVDAILRLQGALQGSLGELSIPRWRQQPRIDTQPSAAPEDCLPPYPTLSWLIWHEAPLDPIHTILVFPNVAARERVDQDLHTSGLSGKTASGQLCRVLTDGPSETDWIAVANVMVGVSYEDSHSNPALPLLRISIQEALEGRGL